MNIIVRPAGKNCCCSRPDTTWERENRDFYCPDSIEVLEWTPIIFARISKAGKCIGERFVSRYYDAINFGALLYTGEDDIAFTSCTDHSSFLPFPLYNPIVLDNDENYFVIKRDEEVLFDTSAVQQTNEGLKKLLEETICLSSRLTSLRIGDMVAVELCQRTRLASRGEGDICFSSTFCGNELFKVRILL